MSKFIVNVQDVETAPDKSTVTTSTIHISNKRFITQDELHYLTDKLLDDKSVSDILIRGLSIDKWNTLKPWGRDLKYMNQEEYYQGKVKDTAKFLKYFQIQLTIVRKPFKNEKKSTKN